jgi:hypothetical protein
MGDDRDATLVMDPGDRIAHGAPGPDAMGHEQAHEMSVAGGDLLAHDDRQRQLAFAGKPSRHDRGVDPLMVRDGDDVQVPGDGRCQHVRDPRHTV